MTPLQKKVLRRFDKYILGWMRQDIDTALGCQANKLAALGLVTYTEILGGLRTGNLGDDTRNQANFNSFFEYLGKEYQKLISGNADIYHRIRCKLVHNYFLERGSAFARATSASCAVQVRPDGSIIIDLDKYNEDFFGAVARYRREILKGSLTLVDKFQKGLNKIRGPC